MDDAARFTKLADALSEASFHVSRDTVGGQEALVARRSDFRWSWFASRLHTFVIAVTVAEMAPDAAETLVAAAQQYAISHKPGLPRGLQTGTATVATLLCADPSDELQAWFRTEPRSGYAAIRLPVLADLANRRLVWFRGRMTRGYIYAPHLCDLIEAVLAPSLGCEA